VAALGVVGGGVLAFGVVAAADVPAALAHAQVDPLHAEPQALLAAGDLNRRIEELDRADVRAGLGRALTVADLDRTAQWSLVATSARVQGMSETDGSGEAITEEGITALRREIEELEGPARTRMAARIKVAREEGDLKENAEYHIAKEDQAHLETKIKRLRERLRTAIVVEIDGDGDAFAFGRTAEVLDEGKGEVNTWTLVGSTEADLAAGRLSAESPIGRALRDAKVGEPIEIETPKGTRTFVVQKLIG
jgi:transcription elongation factor GreA